jgi:hypothetical protein
MDAIGSVVFVLLLVSCAEVLPLPQPVEPAPNFIDGLEAAGP